MEWEELLATCGENITQFRVSLDWRARHALITADILVRSGRVSLVLIWGVEERGKIWVREVRKAWDAQPSL